MTDYLHSGANKMNKVEAYKNDNRLLLADKLGHAKVSSLKEQNLLNTIATVQQHSNKITQLEADANKVRGAYVYKGTVETEFDLPLNDNSVGDVYNISSTGMNYAWTGETWDELGSIAIGGGGSSEWEWNLIPFYEETLTNQFNYNPDLPYTAGKNINLTNIVQTNNKLTHLLLTIERVAPTYGNITGNNNNELAFAFPVYNLGGASYTIFGKTATTTATTKTKHFLIVKPYYGFTKVKYFYYQLTNASTINLDPNYVWVSNLESSFEDILVNDLILSTPSVSIASDLGVGTIIKAYTKKDN